MGFAGTKIFERFSGVVNIRKLELLSPNGQPTLAMNLGQTPILP